MIKNKARNSNIELYRIIVMLFIVSHHYLVNSGLLPIIENLPPPPGNELSFKVCFFLSVWNVGQDGYQLFRSYYGVFHV